MFVGFAGSTTWNTTERSLTHDLLRIKDTRMTVTFDYTAELSIVECAECGMDIYLSVDFVKRRRRDNKGWYCPNGHNNYWPQEGDLARANRLLPASRQREETLRDNLKTTEYKRRVEKAAKTRIKNRISKGVCPCCQRTFQNLGRHMANKHPDYAESA